MACTGQAFKKWTIQILKFSSKSFSQNPNLIEIEEGATRDDGGAILSSHTQFCTTSRTNKGNFTTLTIDHRRVFTTFVMTCGFVEHRHYIGGLIALCSIKNVAISRNIFTDSKQD